MLSPEERAEMLLLEQEIKDLQSTLVTKTHEEEMERCKEDPWYFLVNYVKTLDDKDQVQPIKDFPEFHFAWDMVRMWQAYPYIRAYLYEKSRRMLCTLAHMGLCTHNAMFFDGRANYVVSQNQEKAAIQIERRAAVMYSNLPDWMRAAFPAKPTFCKLIFFGDDKVKGTRKKAGSVIWSVPQEGEQLRGETPSNVIFDEVGAQSQAESNYSALYPALEMGVLHGPRFVGIGTAATGFWDKLVHDLL